MEEKISLYTTDYIPISIIDQIRPSPDRFNDIVIETQEGIFYSSKPFTINSSGISGSFFSFDKKTFKC